MAVTAVTPEVLTRNTVDTDALGLTEATTAADGFLVPFTYDDQKTLFVFYNSNSSTTVRSFTIKAGDGIQGTTDLASGNVAAGKYAAVVIESGKFKITSGDNKGKVLIIPSHAELKMAAVVLP